MKKIFFCLFIVAIVLTSCSDERERIVTVKIRGGNDFDSISKLQIIRSYEGEEVELTEIVAQDKEGRYTTKAMSVLDGSKLEFRVFPGNKHLFEEFTGDLKANNTIAYLEVNGDKEVEALFYFDADIVINEPPIVNGEYLIDHSSHLRWVADKITNDIDGNVPGNFSGKTIKLVDDIYMENIPFTGIASTGLGDGSFKFAGTLDGDGHKIYNINLKTDKTVVGLVGNLGATGSIKNLSLKGSMNLLDINYAGAFVGKGEAGATVENVYNEVDITVSAVLYSPVVGGIAGADVNIKNSYNVGHIQLLSTSGIVAGIIGKGGNLQNVYNIGEISSAKGASVAGIAGEGNGVNNNITAAYNAGSISILDEVVGSKKGGIAIGGYTVLGSYFVKDGSFNEGIIAIADNPSYADVGYLPLQFQFLNILIGFDPTIWSIKTGLKAGNGSKNIPIITRPVITGLGEGKQ